MFRESIAVIRLVLAKYEYSWKSFIRFAWFASCINGVGYHRRAGRWFNGLFGLIHAYAGCVDRWVAIFIGILWGGFKFIAL